MSAFWRNWSFKENKISNSLFPCNYHLKLRVFSLWEVVSVTPTAVAALGVQPVDKRPLHHNKPARLPQSRSRISRVPFQGQTALADILLLKTYRILLDSGWKMKTFRKLGLAHVFSP